MPMEMAVVTFDGTHTAGYQLASLRAAQDDAWLNEVAVLEHHLGGRDSMKAASPAYGEKDHVAAGATIGGLTGLCLGAIAGRSGSSSGRPWGRSAAARSATPAAPVRSIRS